MAYKTIIINASAAKTGGAETIVDTFVDFIERCNSKTKYIIIAPKQYVLSNPNIISIQKSTNSFGTFFFTILLIYWYCLKYNANEIISFNNINVIIPLIKRTTYFHQLRDFKPEYSNLRKKLYYIIIRFFLNGTNFVVQSEIVKEMFIYRFKFSEKNIKVIWPGFKVPIQKDNENLKLEINKFRLSHKYLGICPIAYNGSHKNLDSIFKEDEFLNKESILIISLLENDGKEEYKSFAFIGKVERSDLFYLYRELDFLIFTSIHETVGLPIFEFLQTGKPTFVFEADYSLSFYNKFNQPKNFILFNETNFTEKFVTNLNIIERSKYDYSEGEWSKMLVEQ